MVAATAPTLVESYAACEALARSHYENFPVASRLLPAALRPHVAAVYAFARIADDIADEPGRQPDERLRLLDQWQTLLHSGTPALAHPGTSALEHPGTPAPEHSGTPAPRHSGTAVLPALHDTIARFDLPLSLFDDLLSAFRQDVTTTRYETWAEVLDYCRRSANPVGRIVLRLARQHDAARDAWSDDVCTALQLANFWQDLGVDWPRGRLYVPEEEWRAHGADPADLDRGVITDAWRRTLAASAGRTRALFARGRPV
ncbi:MAG: squalene synthase HpnC, partial [Vicinamibacteria bacterium]